MLSLEVIIVTITVIVSLILGYSLRLRIGGINLSAKPIREYITKLQDIYSIHYKRIISCQNSILRAQMNFAENIIASMQEIYKSNNIAFQLALIMIKSHFKANGLKDMLPHEFSFYVGSRIDTFRNHFKNYIPDWTYVETAEFRDKIASIYNNASQVEQYYTDRIKELDEDLKKQLEELK